MVRMVNLMARLRVAESSGGGGLDGLNDLPMAFTEGDVQLTTKELMKISRFMSSWMDNQREEDLKVVRNKE